MMTEAPSPVTPAQLHDLFITTIVPPKKQNP